MSVVYNFSNKVVLITGGTGALGRTLVKKFIESGAINILVNVVGGYLGGKSIAELNGTDWDTMMNLNLKSAFLISKHVIPIMKSVNGGNVVHISSRTGLKSEGYDSAYAASKAALIRFVESAAQEFKEHHININCILPTTIDTEANRKAMPKADFTKWLLAEDLANVILFLCSSGSGLINGSA